MKKTIKITALAAAGALALTGCMSAQQRADKVSEDHVAQMDYKGVTDGLTCIIINPSIINPSANAALMTCDYVDFYNKYPHLKSEPLSRQ